MNTDFLKTLDAAFTDEATSRRDALRKAGRLGGAAALAATPLYAMASNVAMAKAEARPRRPGAARLRNPDVLNFALTLEYLEFFYYQKALDTEGLIPDEALNLVTTIRDHEEQHYILLRDAIADLDDGDPDIYEMDDFDYTAAGVDPFASYENFLLLAQAFEDTGVRAYKGQAPELQGTAFLTVALQIHSVEARHAAAIRRLRGNEGWIPFDQPGAPAAIAPVYGPGEMFPSEANTTQAGVDLVAALPDYTPEEISEAFDEALEMQPVLNIAGPFITGNPD